MSKGNNDQIIQIIFGTIAAGAALGLLYSGWKSLRRKRLIENVPTSKVAGVFLGLTEVKGAAEDDDYLTSYLAGSQCVWYSYTVEEHWRKTETYTDSDGKTKTRTSSGWTTVKSADVRDPFYLRDDTGRLRIRPEKAEIDGDQVFYRSCGRSDPLYYGKGPAGAISHSTHERRFTEYAIQPKRHLYVMGTARLRDDAVEPEIAHDPSDEMFLISTKSEEKIVSSYGWGASLKPFFGWVCMTASPIIFAGGWKAELIPIEAGLSAVYALANFLHYLLLLYNGLVNVKNRLARAWSLIDIQLKRRFDLIPNLVSCVQGYVKHEKDLMEGLAKIRVEGRTGVGVPMGAIPVGGAALGYAGFANAQTGALTGLFGIVERYPKIKADQSFGKLMTELARTETKIALARSFYNESVTALNNRIETLPDALIAGPGGFKKADYFQIEEFEKPPIVVKLTEDDPPKPKPAPGDAPPPEEHGGTDPTGR